MTNRIVGIVVASLLGTSVLAEEKYEWFAGEWTGTQKVSRAGSCLIVEADPRIETPLSDGRVTFSEVRFVIDVDADGKFTASVYGSRGNLWKTEWTGSVDSDGKVQAVARKHATCPQGGRSYDSTYTGVAKQNRKKLKLVLKGRDETCPDIGCIFKTKYVLSKRPAN